MRSCIVPNLLALLLLSGAAGCEDELAQLEEQFAEPVRDEIKAAVADRGSIDFDVGQPVTTDECHARLLTFNSDRPSVLLVTSYSDAGSESFPSVMLQAQVGVGSIDELADQTVEAKVFVMQNEGGPVLHAGDGGFVKIRISSVGNGKVSGELVDGALFDTDSGEEVPLSGRFDGIIQ